MKLPSIKGVKSPIVRSGNSNKSGVVPTTERRAAAQKRLESMNPETRKRLSQKVSRSKFKAFTRDVLNRYGFDTSSSDITGSSGYYNSGSGLSSTDTGMVALPTLDKPTRVSNDNNPTVSSLEKQFKIVANQLRLLESIAKRQQDNKVLEVLNNNRKTQESILEQGNTAAELQTNGNLTVQIEPLNDQLVALSNSISSLIDILEDKQNEINNDGGGGGQQSFWEDIKDRYLGADRKSKRIRQSREAGSKSQLDAIEKIAANDNKAGPKRGRVADIIGKGLRKGEQLATRLGGSTTKAIENLAAPIIAKGLGKTVLKSIPIVGAVAGVGFAVDRLIHGDVVGAGLDAVSGLAGPLTAIPALIASTSRDIYSSVYGVQPEEDPNASERMSEVTSVVKGVVTKTLTASIEQKPRVKEDSAADGVKGPAKEVLDNAGFGGGGGSFGGAGATGDFSKDGGGGGGGAVAQTGKGPLKAGVQSDYSAADFATGTPSPTTENSGSQAQPKTESAPAPSTKAEKISPKKGKDLNAQFSSRSKKDASTLIQKSEQTEEMATPKIYNISQVSDLPSPQSVLTSKGTASVGNVPDPTYPLTGTLFNQLYFV